MSREGQQGAEALGDHSSLAGLIPFKTVKFRRQTRIFAVFLLVLAFTLMLSSALRKSATVDEQSHLFRGYAYLKSGASQFLLGHPLLGGTLSALPLLSEGELRLPVDDPAWQAGDWSVAGDQFLWGINENPQRLIFLGRLPVIWLTLLLGALVYRWGREWLGTLAGSLALILLLLDPNVLANGRLITGDIPLTLFFVLALYGTWSWLKWYSSARDLDESHSYISLLRQRSVIYLFLAGLGLGLAGATKFNAVLLAPILAVWALYLAWRWRDARPLVALVTIALSAWFVIWATYGFTLWRGYLPGGDFWEDLLWQSRYLYSSHGVYLLGQISPTGWWYYFPIAFLLKTPLISLLLIAWAIWLAIRRKSSQSWLYLVIPTLLYFLASMISALNIGYRYLLPVLPLIFLFIALELARRKPIASRPGVVLCMATLVYGLLAIWVWPDYLSYFNILSGRESWRLLSDSNVDWGQDLPSLSAWQEENGEPLLLSYFGTAHPSAYGLEFQSLPTWPPAPEQIPAAQQSYNPADPAPGSYAISVTNLQGVVLGDERDAYAIFRDQEPQYKIGGSIFIYHVPTRGPAADVAFSGVRPADLDSDLHAQFATNDVRVRWLDSANSFIWPAGGGWLVTLSGEEAVPRPLAGYWPDTPLAVADDQQLYKLPTPPDDLLALAGIDFGGIMTFLGQEMVEVSGDSISLASAWRINQATDRPLKIFVHLLDEDGTIQSQWDGLDVDPGTLVPGDLLVQLHQLVLPDHSSNATISLGLYDGATLERFGEPINFSLER